MRGVPTVTVKICPKCNNAAYARHTCDECDGRGTVDKDRISIADLERRITDLEEVCKDQAEIIMATLEALREALK